MQYNDVKSKNSLLCIKNSVEGMRNIPWFLGQRNTRVSQNGTATVPHCFSKLKSKNLLLKTLCISDTCCRQEELNCKPLLWEEFSEGLKDRCKLQRGQEKQ